MKNKLLHLICPNKVALEDVPTTAKAEFTALCISGMIATIVFTVIFFLTKMQFVFLYIAIACLIVPFYAYFFRFRPYLNDAVLVIEGTVVKAENEVPFLQKGKKYPTKIKRKMVIISSLDNNNNPCYIRFYAPAISSYEKGNTIEVYAPNNSIQQTARNEYKLIDFLHAQVIETNYMDDTEQDNQNEE